VDLGPELCQPGGEPARYRQRHAAERELLSLGTGPGATLFDDGLADQLTGSAGSDWFFIGVAGTITDQHDNELID
jgi:hypothetical protein